MRQEAESQERKNSQEGTAIVEHNRKYEQQLTANERAKKRRHIRRSAGTEKPDEQRLRLPRKARVERRERQKEEC